MIRILDPADPATADALLALQRAAYHVEAQLIEVRDFPPLRETVGELAASDLVFLADVGRSAGAPPRDPGVLAPGERVRAFLAYARQGTDVDIHRLVVHPAAFRQGLASRLLDELCAREPGAARHTVATATRNEPALALYRQHGFSVTGERLAGEERVRIVDLERVPPFPR